MRIFIGALLLVGWTLIPVPGPGPSTADMVAAAPANQPIPLRPIQVFPEKGTAGTVFTTTLDGLEPGQSVGWEWQTWDGYYATNPSPETVAYEKRTFLEERVPVGRSVADAGGMASVSMVAPDDFGEVHAIYAVADGRDVGRGGFRILLSAEIAPTQGPIGTPITISVHGMAATLFSGSTLGVRWDNSYTGVLTATTTHGTGSGRIRASGPAGDHFIVLSAGGVPPYLNIEQSPYDFFYAHLDNQEDIRLSFNVTREAATVPDMVDWPRPNRVAQLEASAPRTANTASLATSMSVALEPASGPILSTPRLRARGLAPGSEVQMWWVTARGNRVTPSGWSLADIPLPSAMTSAAGTLEVPITVPDDLGGWHALKLAQDGAVVGDVPYYVERSLVEVSARSVRTGDTVVVRLKGIGWTELDNGVAVTYDNSQIGYACGFNSNGDVVLQILATGAPGTHLIDMYPMVYAGKDPKAWYWAPVLSYADDFPALDLGYRLPAFRISIEIVDETSSKEET